MSKSITFYHAGCSVCVSAEQALLDTINPAHNLKVIHLGEQPEHIAAAEAAGVKTVPALVIDGAALHINFGANLSDLK